MWLWTDKKGSEVKYLCFGHIMKKWIELGRPFPGLFWEEYPIIIVLFWWPSLLWSTEWWCRFCVILLPSRRSSPPRYISKAAEHFPSSSQPRLCPNMVPATVQAGRPPPPLYWTMHSSAAQKRCALHLIMLRSPHIFLPPLTLINTIRWRSSMCI